jgi:O-antigen/teichoic acid export membrane protein
LVPYSSCYFRSFGRSVGSESPDVDLGRPDHGRIPRARHPLGFSSAGVFTASTLVQIAGFVGSIFLYKFVGVSSQGQALLGTVQLYLLIASSISSVGDLRIGSAYTFLIARGKPPIDVTATYVALRFVIVGAAAILILLVAPVSLDGRTLASSAGLLEIVAAILSLPLLWSLPAVYAQLFIAQGDSVKAQYPSLVEVAVRTPLLLFVALYAPNIWGITLAYLAGAGSSTLFSLPSIFPYMSRYSGSEGRSMLRFAWPLMGSLALAYLVTNSVPFIVEAAAGVRELNIFNAANGFRLVALTLATAIATPLFPLVSGLHQRGAFAEIRIQIIRTLRFGMMLVVPVSVAIVAYRTDLIHVFTTPRYLPGSDALAILALSVIPASLSTLIYTSLVSIGRQRLELYIAGFQTVTLFGIAFLLLSSPAYTLGGGVLVSASLAVLISSVVGLVANLYFLSAIMVVRLPLRSAGWIIVAGALGLAVGFLIDVPFSSDPLLHLILGTATGLGLFAVILALTGELTKSDVRAVIASLRLPPSFGDVVARACWKAEPPKSLYQPIDRASRLEESGYSL